MVEIILALLGFGSQFATAYLGWRVTVDGGVPPSRRKLYESLFILGGLIGAGSIGWATYRANSVAVQLAAIRQGQNIANTGIQTANQGIADIKNNQSRTIAVQPPVGIPASESTVRAILQVKAWGPPFIVDKRLQCNIIFKNMGQMPSSVGSAKYHVKIISYDVANMENETNRAKFEEKMWMDLRRDSQWHSSASVGIGNEDVEPARYGEIAEEEWKLITEGEKVIYVLGIKRYPSLGSSKSYETEYCGFYWAKDPNMVHSCVIHNVIR